MVSMDVKFDEYAWSFKPQDPPMEVEDNDQLACSSFDQQHTAISIVDQPLQLKLMTHQLIQIGQEASMAYSNLA